jgi:VWFA-related protein
MRTIVFAALTAALVTPGAVNAADGIGAAAAEPPVFATQVSLVLLPVFAVDSDGHAVRGLQPTDFELTQDGRHVEIVSFRYVDTTDPDDQEALRQASAARRRFLLLFDKSFTDPAGLNRAQRAAADFVKHQLAPSDLAGVATFDVNQGIRIVANFTDDRRLLEHAVDTLGVPTLTRVSDPLALAADLSVTDLALTSRDASQSNQGVLDNVMAVLVKRLRAAEDQAYRANVALLESSLRDLAVALRGVEGRKQVLYFSAGFDSRLLVGERGDDLKQMSQSVAEGRIWEVDGSARYGDAPLRDMLAQVTRSLANSDTVMHSIDVTGLAQGTGTSLSKMRAADSNVGEGTGREFLHFLAAETGGRFFKDANDLGPALREMLDMTSRYYVLGYQPEALKAPGTFHRIRVRVQRKNVQLSHRTGYYERTPRASQTVLERKFEAAQLVVTGAGPETLHFSALVLPFPTAGERQSLGLVLQIPRDQLRWLKPAVQGVEVYAYAVDEEGTVRDHLAQLARIDLSRSDPGDDARGLSIQTSLSVPPGRYTVRLMVTEAETGSSGVQFLDVVVPPRDGRAGFLLPPVIMEDPLRWIPVEMARLPEQGAAFVLGGKPFVPRTSVEIESGIPEKLVLIAYAADMAGDPAASVEIRSSLTDAQGRSVAPGPVRLSKVHREGGRRAAYVLDYTPQDLTPGDYTLRIAVAEAGSDLQSYTRVRVRAAQARRD